MRTPAPMERAALAMPDLEGSGEIPMIVSRQDETEQECVKGGG
jgi:hypothetical protein